MKKNIILTLLFLFVVTTYAQKAKYVFFFIGDGMGQNIVNVAEGYKNYQKDGEYKNGSITFTEFPVFGISTTHSESNDITDSAAAGTALSTGEKTSNGTLAMSADHSRKLRSMAFDAKENEKAVGIITTVSLDHATPAAFYASQPSRSMSYEIAMDGIDAGFDLYGGSGFVEPTAEGKPEVYSSYEKAGYTIIKGKKELSKINSLDTKILITERDQKYATSLSYAIDRTEDDMSLSGMLESSIEYLTRKGGRKGFFIMAEGGKIDWAGHSNDGKTELLEVLDFDDAVRVAYEFYKKHPKETLIVVTADHETGGFSLIGQGSQAKMPMLDQQSISYNNLENELVAQSDSWDECKDILKSKLGLWSNVEVTKRQENNMILAYYKDKKSVVTIAIKILMNASGLGWSSGDHTSSPVGVYAIGVGSHKFSGKQDNIELSKNIRTAL